MGRISELTIDLDVDGRKEQRELRKSQSEWRRHSGQVRRSLSGVSRNVRIAGAAVTAGLAVAIKSSLDFVDASAKAARNAGASIQGYTRLRHAFEEAGSSGQVLTKALGALNKRILDAENGLSTATRSFDALGVKLSDLEGLDTEQKFALIVEALSRVEDPGRRAAIAMEVFGGAARQMGTILEGGRTALDAAGSEADRFGITITTNTSAIEEFNDTLDLARKTFLSNFAQGVVEAVNHTGDFRSLILEAAPAAREFGGAIADLTRWLIENRDILVKVLAAYVALRTTVFAAAVVTAIGTFATAISGAVAALAGMAKVVGAGSVIAAAFTPAGWLVIGVGAVAAAVVLFRDEIQAFLDGPAKPFADYLRTLSQQIEQDFAGFRERFDSRFERFVTRPAPGPGAPPAVEPPSGPETMPAAAGRIDLGTVAADEYTRVVAGAQQATVSWARALSGLGGESAALAEAQEEYNALVGRTTGLISANQSVVERLLEDEAALVEAARRGIGDQEQLAAALASVREQLRAAQIESGTFAEQFGYSMEQAAMRGQAAMQTFGLTVGHILNSATHQTGQAFGQWVVYGGSFRDSMENILRQVLAQIISTWATATIQTVLFGNTQQAIAASTGAAWTAVFSGIPQLLGSVFSAALSIVRSFASSAGSILGGIFGFLGNAAGGVFSSLGFQEGGIVPGSPGAAVPVIAHAGELILNAAQQDAVAGMIASQSSGAGAMDACRCLQQAAGAVLSGVTGAAGSTVFRDSTGRVLSAEENAALIEFQKAAFNEAVRTSNADFVAPTFADLERAAAELGVAMDRVTETMAAASTEAEAAAAALVTVANAAAAGSGEDVNAAAAAQRAEAAEALRTGSVSGVIERHNNARIAARALAAITPFPVSTMIGIGSRLNSRAVTNELARRQSDARRQGTPPGEGADRGGGRSPGAATDASDRTGNQPFHEGGRVPGPPGRELDAVLQGGETVLTGRHQAALREALSYIGAGVGRSAADAYDLRQAPPDVVFQVYGEMTASVRRAIRAMVPEIADSLVHRMRATGALA